MLIQELDLFANGVRLDNIWEAAAHGDIEAIQRMVGKGIGIGGRDKGRPSCTHLDQWLSLSSCIQLYHTFTKSITHTHTHTHSLKHHSFPKSPLSFSL